MNKNYNIWIFAGEASGDLYGAKLTEHLQQLAATNGDTVKIAAMGGPEMQKTDAEIMVDSTELGVVGAIEVLKHIFTFLKIFRMLVNRAIKERPDAVILIDYPGFNLQFAARMFKHKIPVIWYISPHVWTWGKRRIPKLAKYCRKMLLIFPFEKDVYSETSLTTEFVGHPLVELVRSRKDPAIVRDPDTVVLLPGSRFMEINRLLKPMLETVIKLKQKHPKLKFTISTPREKVLRRCEEIVEEFRHSAKGVDLPKIELDCGRTAYWMQKAATGLAASGTVTVESAIAGLPLVVAYKLNPITMFMAMLLVRLYRGFFTMTNIIANKTVFEEFLQWRANPESLSKAMEKILPGGERRTEVEQQMQEVTEALSGGSKSAFRKTAQSCIDFVASNREAKQISD